MKKFTSVMDVVEGVIEILLLPMYIFVMVCILTLCEAPGYVFTIALIVLPLLFIGIYALVNGIEKQKNDREELREWIKNHKFEDNF